MAALLTAATPATAQNEPRFCPNNPSLESSACTTEPGRVHLEVTAVDWQLERGAGSRTDTVLVADTLLRIGVASDAELQLEWTPYGHVRERDDGVIDRRDRVGDVTVAWRQSLRNPDGKGLSYGVQPFVTLPVGRSPVGAGTWAAGVILPLTYDLTDAVNVGLTGELDAAADEDGTGRHLAASMVLAASLDLTGTLSATAETQVLRDDDPMAATTQWVGGLGLSWRVAKTRSVFAEAVGGLNGAAPDIRLYAGFASLF